MNIGIILIRLDLSLPPGNHTCEAAVVVTVTVAVAVVPLNDTVPGEILHVAPVGAPLQVSVTIGLSPPPGVNEIAKLAVCPGVTATVAAPLGATVKSWPVPVSVTVSGLPGALSVMVNIPVRLPPAVGVKVTLIWQLAAMANDAPQVLVSAKSPEAEICVMFKAAVPVLLKVTLCDALAVPATCALYVRADGFRLTCGLSDIPDTLINGVFPGTLSAIVSIARLVPPAVGVNVTLTVHPFPGAKALVQVLV
jgi:hypothetical protein